MDEVRQKSEYENGRQLAILANINIFQWKNYTFAFLSPFGGHFNIPISAELHPCGLCSYLATFSPKVKNKRSYLGVKIVTFYH